MPSHSPPRIPLTPEIRQKLRAHIERTGVGPQALLRGAGDKPQGLSSSVISKWLAGGKTARRDHLAYVMHRWETVDPVVPVTPLVLQALQLHKDRTGLTPEPLLRSAKTLPSGLTTSIVRSWLEGRVKRAKRSHLDFVLAQWERCPDRDLSRVPVTAEVRARMEEHRVRTGIGVTALGRMVRNPPAGLTVSKVRSWLYGSTKSACRTHLEYVFAQWEALPTRPRPKPFVPRPEDTAAVPSSPPQTPFIRAGYRLEELSNNIRAIRLERGMTNDDLAEACGVTRATVNRWEIRKDPLRPETARTVACAFGCSVEALYS